MPVYSLLIHGSETLVRMALHGELSKDQLWVAMKGAERYRKAMKTGDITMPVQLAHRGTKCAACPLATRESSTLFQTEKVYCGQAFVETENTCGCLVGVSVDGEFIPGGKAAVQSERCPSEKW